MYNFKSKIETEQEMKTYEKNADNYITKIKSIFLKAIELLTQGKSGKVLSCVGSIPLLKALNIFDGTKDDNNLSLKKINDPDNDDDFWDYEDDDDDDDINSENSKLIETFKELWKNTELGLYIYSALSFIHLGLSVWEFHNAYKDLTQIKKNITDEKGYENTLKKIQKNFNEHKEKIGILPDDFKESLKIIKETFKEICEDYIELNKLIESINNDIGIAKSHEKNSTIGLIGSVGLGVAGFFVTKNPFCFLHSVSLTTNIATGIGHTICLVKSKETIEKLIEIKDKSEKQKNEMKVYIDDLIKIITDLEKGQLPKSKKKFIVNYEKNKKK